METLRIPVPSSGGVSLHAQVQGDPGHPCVVLLHGGGANLHWWDEIAPLLESEFRIARVDFRGHGDSDYPEAVEAGAFGRDLDALLAALGNPAIAIVGHSMGGHVALDHAARDPRVWAAVAVEVSFGEVRREQRRTRLALTLRRFYSTREEAVRRFRVLPPSENFPEARRRSLAEHSVLETQDGRFAFKFDPRWFGLPPASHARLDEIRCPTLVIRGSESTLLTREGAESLVARFGDGRLLEIPDTGHNVHLEAPEAVAEALLAHLRPHAPQP